MYRNKLQMDQQSKNAKPNYSSTEEKMDKFLCNMAVEKNSF